MDDARCAFGVFSTYNKTYFLKRENDNTFKASAPVMATDVTSASVSSLRECIFFLALQAANAASTFWTKRSGLELVSICTPTGYVHRG